MRTYNNRIKVALVASMVALLPQLVEAQVVPFHARGVKAQYAPATGEYSGGGVGTHVGWHMNAGNAGSAFALVPTGSPGEFFWITEEPHVITAADGSTISFQGGGLVQLIPLDPNTGLASAVWSAEFEITGGSGRFANVKPGNGPIAVSAINDPFFMSDTVWTFSWTFDGTIDLGRRRN